MNSLGMLRSAMLATASAWVLLPQASLAQSPAQIGAQNIPSVTVTAPEARRRAISVQRRAPRSSQQTANRNRPQPPRNVGFVETPLGPVHGYVAGRSSSGTKTNTPIMETPQAVSVIGAEQIRDQKANKLDEVLRYTGGVRAGTFGADSRNDWWLIRGFKSDDVGLFLDGMQLFYTSYASWKLQTPNMERRRGAARSIGRALWRIEPERHRQRHQQDAAGGARPFHRDRRQQFRQRLCRLRCCRSGQRATRTASCSTASSVRSRTAPRRSISRRTTTTSSRRR
ncbi:hypothetical protein ACVWZL_003781 [Bradyrhizobium sp. GM2.4]